MAYTLNIRQIGVFSRTYRHAMRYRQILAILLKYGFGDLVERLKIEKYLELGGPLSFADRFVDKLTSAERFRCALEELGPTFIKFGQLLSTQRELLPFEYVVEMEKLQDRVPPFPVEQAREIVAEELGVPLGSVYKDFSVEPIAAASIGQVHKARLMASGREVVVKVQRPNIREIVEVDLEIMYHIAVLAEKHLEGWDIHKPTKLVEEFRRSISRELDFQVESSHLQRFAHQFADEEMVHVPAVYTEASSSRILTMEYVHGVKPSSPTILRERGLDPHVVADRGFDLLMKQIFEHGYFHADPHPGNHIIMPGNVICYIDFGMMGYLARREREEFADLVWAIAERRSADAAEAFIRLAEWDEEPDRSRLEKAVDEFMNQHFHKSLRDMELGRFMQELVEIIVSFEMRLPESFLFVIKALTTIEGMGRSLNAEFNPISRAEPFLRRFQAERYHPKNIADRVMRSGREMLEFVGELPQQLRELLRQLKTGRTKIEFEHQGLEPLLGTLEHIASRLSLAILVGSLVIGSSLIVVAGVPPVYNGIPLIGLIGFIIAGVMTMWLIVGILREGRK